MLVQSTRFGQINIEKQDLLNFPEGLLGFSSLRSFVLLEDPNDDIFVWLQSCELGEIAFPVLEPEFFLPNYKTILSKNDMDALKISGSDKTRFFSIVTIPEDAQKMTANMKAPIVINVEKRTARQCVLQDNNLAIREPIFALLQQRIVQKAAKIREPDALKSVAVTLPLTSEKEAFS